MDLSVDFGRTILLQIVIWRAGLRPLLGPATTVTGLHVTSGMLVNSSFDYITNLKIVSVRTYPALRVFLQH